MWERDFRWPAPVATQRDFFPWRVLESSNFAGFETPDLQAQSSCRGEFRLRVLTSPLCRFEDGYRCHLY